MYSIFTYIYHKKQPNVGKYTIHSMGQKISSKKCESQNCYQMPSLPFPDGAHDGRAQTQRRVAYLGEEGASGRVFRLKSESDGL